MKDKNKSVPFLERLAAVTDWLLILLGGLLIFKALAGIDLAVARYVVAALGALFLAAGLRYRHCRRRRGSP